MQYNQSGESGLKAIIGRLSYNSAWVMAGTVSSSIFMLCATAINARALTLSDFGTLVLMQTTLTAISGILSLGTQQPVLMFGSQALTEKDYHRIELISVQGLALDILSAVSAAILATSIVVYGSNWLGLSAEHSDYAMIFAITAGFCGFRTGDGILRLFGEFRLLSAIPVFVGLFQLIAAFIMIATNASFPIYVWVYAFACAAPFQLQLWCALLILRRRGLKLNPFIMIGAPNWREFINYSVDTWLTSTIDSIRSSIDSLLVGYYVSISGAGLYHASKQISGILRKAVSVYASTFFPEVARLSSEKRLIDAARLLKYCIFYGIIVTLLLFFIAWMLSDFVIEIVFGPAYISAKTTLTIMVFAASLMFVSHSLAMYVQAFVGSRDLTKAYFFAMVAFLIAILPLVNNFGIIGGAISQVIFVLISSLTCLSIFSKWYKLNIKSDAFA